MGKEAISSAAASKPVGPYSLGVKVNNFLYMSGQVGNPGGKIVEGGIGPETKATLDKCKAILADQDRTLDDVVKSTVFITDMTKFSEMNEVYATYFSEPFPARSCVEVSKLPVGASVEIELIVNLS